LPTGAQVFNLPHKAQPPGKFVAAGEEIKMLCRIEPAVTGETACPTKTVAACKGIRM